MIKQNTDVFLVNELIGNNLTDFIVEGDAYVPDNMQGIEKIIYTTGNVKLTNISTLTNKVAVYGDLNYTILYRQNNEDGTISAINGKIDFMEDIPIQNASEGMTVNITPSIDYIDSKIVSDYKVMVKAVINFDITVTNNHDINYISAIEPTDSCETKTNTVTYSDIIDSLSSEMTMDENIVLEPNESEIGNILKINVNPIITECDIMNERMILEGTCTVGVLYTELNGINGINYCTRDFPFTHYVDAKDAYDTMMNNVDIIVTDINYELIKDDNDEARIVNFETKMSVEVVLYDTIEKSMISDAYSTTNELELECSDIVINTLVDCNRFEEKFERTFDIEDIAIKDICYYETVAKISDKNIYDDSVAIEGFFDVNIVYKNGDTNKIECATSSIPFTLNVDLSMYDHVTDVESKICLKNVGVYRKGINTIVFEAIIVNKIKVTYNIKMKIIKNMFEGEKLNYKNTPSIIFRVVQPNESLWDIAKNYNVSINYICKLNNIDMNNELTPGTKLILMKKI